MIVREIVVIVREILIYMSKKVLSPSPTSLKLFTFCFYIGKNTYQELVRMLYVLLASLDKFHPDFFLVVYHNLGITIDDPRVRMVRGLGGGGGGEVKDGDSERLLLEAPGCDGNVWIEGSAVRNRWHKLSFNKIHVFKNLYDEYGGVCFTWIDLDTIVLADMSYLNEVDNYFVMHGGAVSDRMHDVLVCDGDGGGGGGGGRVIWSIPERTYIQGSFWKLNLSLYHEVLRLDSMFREIGVRGKYDLQSLFAVMAWGGGLCPYYDGPSRVLDGGGGSMLIIGENFMPGVMNGLGVWDTKRGVGNHVNTESLAEMRWVGANGGGGGDGAMERLSFRTSMYPDKEIHILSLTFDSFFMSNVSVASDFARLFPFLLV